MKNKRFYIILSLFTLISCFAIAQETHLFVSGANVRIRSAGNTSGKVVATLPLGTWAEILQIGTKQQKLVGKNDYWYQIRDEKNNEGWIFGGLTKRCTLEQKYETASNLIFERIESYGRPIAEAEQLYAFANVLLKQATTDEEKALMELGRLQSLQFILDTLSSMGKGSETTHFALKDSKNDVYYHESAGQQYLYPKVFWSLAEKYQQTPAGDLIALRASKQMFPGETEGDPIAELSLLCWSDIKYLQMFPGGKSANTILKNIKATLEAMPDGFSEGYFSVEGSDEYRNAFLTDLATVEKTIKNCSSKDIVKSIMTSIEKLKLIAKK